MTVGVFDSGLGGLTVVRALRRRFPGLSVVYFGDMARFPYGNKSRATIVRYARESVEFLIRKGVQAIVVACNTATSAALEVLQRSFALPILGVVEPGARCAVERSRAGRIGVIATRRTVLSGSYTRAIKRLLPTAHVEARACPLLVSIAEDGAPCDLITQLAITHYVQPLIRRAIDTLILGCTHYPLLEPLFSRTLGSSVAIVDPAEACAEMLPLSVPSAGGEIVLYTSDDTARFRAVARTILSDPQLRVHLIPPGEFCGAS